MAVRRERVVLDLEDNFSSGMARAAAATALLDKSLDRLDGSAVRSSTSVRTVSDDTDRLSTSAVRGNTTINQLSGRLRLLAHSAAVLGPALAPIGAVGIAGVAGLANQFGFAAIAAGTAIAAFQGVGDALTAVNKAALDPTVKNLEEAQKALKLLSPESRALVGQLQEMRPLLTDMRDTAAGAFFPGLIDGLESLERLAPAVNAILSEVGETLGDLVASGAESLASDRWADFFAVLATNARPMLTDMASAIGSVVHGMSELWEAFMPLNRDFGSWLADGARGFDKWAQGLSQTEGFEEFVDYIRENGPKVAEASAAIASALVQIVQAAAPIGGPILDALAGFFELVADIADSPLGTPIMAAVTAMSALSLATNVATAATLRLKAAQASLTPTGGTTAKGAKGGTAPVVAGGGPMGIAALAGFLNLPDEFEHVKSILNGDTGLIEGFGRLAGAMSPVGQVAQLLGLDILGTKKPFLESTVAAAKLDSGLGDLEGSAVTTRGEVRRFGNTFFGANKEMLQTARTTEKVKAALKEQREAVRAAADEWGDYSDKIELGKTSVDDLIQRWDKIGEASRDFGRNVQAALKRGLDPKVIRDIIETLGPRGAAGALEELANATPKRASQIESSFRRMSRGISSGFRDTMNDLNGLIAGVDELGGKKAKPTADLNDAPLRTGVASAERLLTGLGRVRPEPNAEIDISGLRGGVASAEQLLTGLNGDTAHTYVVTHLRTVRDGGDTAGGPPQLRGADGMTVPGPRQPYGDKVLAYLAPGEEVISNRHGQADRFRRDRALGLIPAYGDGGQVGMPEILTRGRDNDAERESRETGRALRGLRAELKETTKALEKERAERDKIIDRMKTLGSDVRGGLRSDLFGEVNPWETRYGGSSPAGVMGTLRSDLGEARKMRQAIKRLRAKGLTGPALAAVLSQGGLEGALAFAELPRSELREYAELYNRRNRVLRSVGQQAGSAAYGAALRDSRQDVKALTTRLDRIEAAIKHGNKDRKDEHGKDRDAQRRGAGNGQRNRRRDR